MPPHEDVIWNNISATPANFPWWQLRNRCRRHVRWRLDHAQKASAGWRDVRADAHCLHRERDSVYRSTAGTYQLAIANATAVYARISRVPGVSPPLFRTGEIVPAKPALMNLIRLIEEAEA